MSRITHYKRIHFVGIGGIAMSALVHYFLMQGAKVTGSDVVRSSITESLKKKGVAIKIGPHHAHNVPKAVELIIYTAAAKPTNPELLAAARKNVLVLSYPEALGAFTKEKRTIAVAGTHGKSTTASLAGLLLWRAQYDPTVIVGTKIKEFGGIPFRGGKSEWLVVEADDWQAGQLGHWPQQPSILIITNIDKEHLDVFPNLAAIRQSFQTLAEKVPHEGAIIANHDDIHARKALRSLKRRILWYSLYDKEAKRIRRIIKVPGEHNVSNALAVWRLGKLLKIPEKTIVRTIENFHGTWRRFEYKGKVNGARVFSDYGHHPSEIKATLGAARHTFQGNFAQGGKLWCVFQPHQYQRTKFLFKEFGAAFDSTDYLLLLDIFKVEGAREKESIMRHVNSKMLAETIQKRKRVAVKWVEDFKRAAAILTLSLGPHDVCMIMGAGDIEKIFKYFAPRV